MPMGRTMLLSLSLLLTAMAGCAPVVYVPARPRAVYVRPVAPVVVVPPRPRVRVWW